MGIRYSLLLAQHSRNRSITLVYPGGERDHHQRSRAAHNTGESKIRPNLILRILASPVFWLLAGVDMGTHFCISSLSNFVLSILEGFRREGESCLCVVTITCSCGLKGIHANLMTTIVYACALVGITVSARVADKTGRRGMVICFNACIAVVGYALLLGLKSNSGRFAATCIVACFTYATIVINLAWVAINNPGYTYRASAAASVNIVSQLLAISGNQAYADPPYYKTGNSAALALIAFSGVCSAVLQLYLRRLNSFKRRDMHSEDAERMRQEFTVDDIGYRHPDVLFQY